MATGFVFNSEFSQTGYHRPVSRGRKNLRCFPHCRAKGHVQSGFCGSPIEFQLNSLPASANGNVERVLTWGEFASVLAPPRFNPGDIIPEETLENDERCAKKPLNALLRGDLDEHGELSSQSPSFQFNAQMASYHCDWVPQTPPVEDDRPCFVVHVFLQDVNKNGQVTLECLFSCRSQSFNIVQRGHKTKSSKPKRRVTKARAAASTLASLKSIPAVQREKNDVIDSDNIRKLGNSSRKRPADVLPGANETATHGGCVDVETPEEQAERINAWWLRQAAASPLHEEPLVQGTTSNGAWIEMQTPPQQQSDDGDYLSSLSCMPDTPPPVSPFPDWDYTDDSATFIGYNQQHIAKDNNCREFVLPPERVTMDDAKTSSDPKLASKRRRGAAVAKSARWWMRTVRIRMRSIAKGVVEAIQNDPLIDIETKELSLLYPNLGVFILQHSTEEAQNRYGAGRDTGGVKGMSGLFAEGELAAMFGSDVTMFGPDLVSYMADESLWDLLDEDVGDCVSSPTAAASSEESAQIFQSSCLDINRTPMGGIHNEKSELTAASTRESEVKVDVVPPKTLLSRADLNDNKAFQTLFNFMLGDELTQVIDEAISNIGNEYSAPDIVTAIRAMFAYNLDAWTAEREKLVQSLLSFLSCHVTTAVNMELKTRGVSHTDVMELASQLPMQSNNNDAELMPLMENLAQRLIGEYAKNPMPDSSVPVTPSHLDLTGKWERNASIEAGCTQEQLELTAAMNAISLDGGESYGHHHSPHVSTSVSQQYTITHQQNALKIQGKNSMIASHDAFVLLDGVARTEFEHGGQGENLTFPFAPRLRGWHTPDGSAIMAVSMPIVPETTDDDPKEGVGSSHCVVEFKRTGIDTLSIKTMIVRHHETPKFMEEIMRVYLQPDGIVDTVALNALPGCSLFTSVTEEYSRMSE